jgi:O-antigen/teichoic acid export membrane protein
VTAGGSRLRLLRRNLVSTYAVYAASLVSGLVVTPIIVNELGTTEYGLWAFISSITVYLALLDLGVGPSIVRFAAEHRGRGATEDTSSLASVGLVVYGAIALVTIAVAVPLAWLVPLLVEIPDSLVTPARAATILVVAGIAARFPLGMFGNLLVGQQRYDVINLANLVSIVLYTVLVAVVLTAGGGGIVLLAWLALAATLVRLALPMLWVGRELPALRLGRRLVSRARLRELMSFSWHNFLIHVTARVVFSADVVVVGVALGAAAAAYYAIPAKLFGLAFGLAVAATNLLYPAFAEAEGAAEVDRQRAYLLGGLRAGMALALVVALPLVLVPDQLIEGWIGDGFGESTWVAVLLGLVLVVHQPAHVMAQYLVARARQRSLARVLLVTTIANVALSIALALTVGLWGVALATLVTEIAAAGFLVPRLVTGASGLSYLELARSWVRPLAPAALAAALVLVLFARLYDPTTLLELVPLGLLWLAVVVPLVWRFGFSGSERRSFRRELRGGGGAATVEGGLA